MKKAKSKKKKWVVLGVCTGAVLATGIGMSLYSKNNFQNEELAYKETTIQRGNLTFGITESGSVSIGSLTQEFKLEESSSSSASYSAMGGAMGGNTGGNSANTNGSLEVEEVYVAAGQNVEKGEALFKISQESIDDYRDSLKKAVSDASASLSEAKLAAEKQQLSADYGYSSSIAKGNVAESNYNATLAQLESEINQAQEDVDYYTAVVEHYLSMVQNGDASYESKYTQVVEKKQEAQAKLVTAQNNYTTKSIEAQKTYE